MENDLHARAQTLARARRCRISFLGRWDGSGGITRDNYLTPNVPTVTNLPLPPHARRARRRRRKRLLPLR
jgi:hypothetical protein